MSGVKPEYYAPSLPRGPLSLRQQQIVQLLAYGHSIKQAAGSLGIAQRTASDYLLRAMVKVQVSTPFALLGICVANGWVECFTPPECSGGVVGGEGEGDCQ